MEKRNSKRILSNVDARFFYGNMFYSGNISNCSQNGMFISTKICLPSHSIFVVIIPRQAELLKVQVRVRRIKKINGYYDGLGVELLNPQKEYLEFVDSLRPVINSNKILTANVMR